MKTMQDDKSGHRKRLRKRFLLADHVGFQDYELLELFLTYALPRRDVKPLAKNLLARFHDLSGVFDASVEELTESEGIGENAAVLLKLTRSLSVRYLQNSIQTLPFMNHVQNFYDYARLRLGDQSDEVMLVFFLNAANILIKEEVLGIGTIDQVNIFPNKIAKQALLCNAKAIVLCHNHPSGVVTPSLDDTQTTFLIKRALKNFDIVLLDHLIVSKYGYYSYREEDEEKPVACKILDPLPNPSAQAQRRSK